MTLASGSGKASAGAERSTLYNKRPRYVTFGLTDCSVARDGEGERVSLWLRVSDAAESVGRPDADGVVHVGQLVGVHAVHFGSIVKAADLAGGGLEVL